MRFHPPGVLHPTVLLSALLLASFLALPAKAQDSAVLRVLVTASDGMPLRGAHVVIEGTGIGRMTDAEGVALVRDLASGSRTVRVSILGYESEAARVQLRPEGRVDVRFALEVRPLALVGITVKAPRSRVLDASGFYIRQEDGFGSFLTRSQIEQRRPSVVSDLLRSVAGVQLGWSLSGRQPVSMVRNTGTRCVVQYYLDGISVSRFDVDSLRPSEIEGVEIYRGPAQIPLQFRGRGGLCSVIVIWTRVD